jgi:hypothetical protein
MRMIYKKGTQRSFILDEEKALLLVEYAGFTKIPHCVPTGTTLISDIEYESLLNNAKELKRVEEDSKEKKIVLKKKSTKPKAVKKTVKKKSIKEIR